MPRNPTGCGLVWVSVVLVVVVLILVMSILLVVVLLLSMLLPRHLGPTDRRTRARVCLL